MAAVPDSDLPKYQGVLRDAKAKVKAIQSWKERGGSANSEDFDRELQQALGYCKAAFGLFRDDQQLNR